MSLEPAIKAHALSLGFDLVGVTGPDPPESFEHFRTWIAEGHAGTMDYLVRSESLRASPAALMPEVRSIVVVGVLYRAPGPDARGDAPIGRVSCHAWGDDYHEWIRDRLARLLQFIESATPCRGRICVDTAPLLERDLARRAGLGWIGKNSMLVNDRLGTYLFLGELLLSIELAPDAPVAPRCGDCTRCLDACPAGALVGPYRLDARRCISYLTIELKGAIPAAQRSDLGEWIYGCDQCQEACPWNRRAPESRHAAYRPRDALNPPDLHALLTLNEQGYRSAFRTSAMRRAKRRGLLRNVAVAIGNRGDARDVPALCDAMKDPDALVRRHVAWALGRMPGPDAPRCLQDALAHEQDPAVRDEITAALERTRT